MAPRNEKKDTPSPIFRTKEVHPEDLSAGDASRLYLELLETAQKLAQGFASKDEITKAVGVDHPIHVYVIGDLHFGHISSDGHEIIELTQHILDDPYAGVIFVGDEIEGFTTKYPSTSTIGTQIPAQQQIELVKELLFRPLGEQGRILAMVGDYFGHPGWINDASTIDPWRLMTDVHEISRLEEQLNMYNAYRIRIITNGGLLHLDFPNGHRQSLRVFHYPEGKSKIDPLHGLREDATNESADIRPDGLVQGHLHRAAVAKENYAGPGGVDVAVFYISSGSAKGSNRELPRDDFGRRIGRSTLADPIGQGVIIIPRRRGGRFDRNYPFISFKHGETAGAAIDLLEATEQQKLTDDLLGQIKAQDQPQIKFVDQASRIARAKSPNQEQPPDPKKAKSESAADPDGTTPDRYPMKISPVYDSLTYDIDTQLPVALHLISNARLGSTVEGYRPLKNYLAEFVANDPHSLVVYLRNMIDRSVLQDSHGYPEADRFVRLIKPTAGQTIAILLDQNLRRSRFPFPPGSYIAQATDTPLIHHLSFIKIAVGPSSSQLVDKPLYTGAFADNLERSGSYDKPTFGLLQLYRRKLPIKPGYVAGGNMPNSGTMMFYHQGNSETRGPALVAPGWWSDYVDTIGVGNVKETSIPGQAIIFMPGATKADYMVFPTASADETRYMHDALTLLTGLRLLGLSPYSVLPR